MGFYDVLELSGVTLHGTISTITDTAICELVLDITSPDLLVAYKIEALLVNMGSALPLAVVSPDLLLEYDDEDLILVCPY